jgi:hypothetical protein
MMRKERTIWGIRGDQSEKIFRECKATAKQMLTCKQGSRKANVWV